MLMQTNTSKGREIRTYFIKTETLASVMRDFISKNERKQLLSNNENLLSKNEKLQHELDSRDSQKERIKDAHIHRPIRKCNQTIYIISSRAYAEEGMFKIGRTRCTVQKRLTDLNAGRVHQDSLEVLKTFAVSDSVSVERFLHIKLKDLRCHTDREFFRCPFDDLVKICNQIIDHSDHVDLEVDELINNIKTNDSREWTKGVDMNIFDRKLRLMADTTEFAEFDISEASEQQIDIFIQKCTEAYDDTIGGYMKWKSMKDVICNLIKKTPIFAKYRNAFLSAKKSGSIYMIFREMKS